MTYKGPPNSCPHFDNAIDGFDNLTQELKATIDQAYRDLESEIEKAREINATLRDDNIALTSRVEALEEELAEARSQIQTMRDEE